MFIKNTNRKMATFDEVKDIPNHPEKYLIDVRNPNELEETGVLPGSINIPGMFSFLGHGINRY